MVAGKNDGEHYFVFESVSYEATENNVEFFLTPLEGLKNEKPDRSGGVPCYLHTSLPGSLLSANMERRE